LESKEVFGKVKTNWLEVSNGWKGCEEAWDKDQIVGQVEIGWKGKWLEKLKV
jgi:hypothetical protein